MLAVSQKGGDCRKNWPGMYIEACSEITLLVPKCFWIKTARPNGTWIYLLIWVSPLFENQGRMHKQCGLISLYCVMCTFQDVQPTQETAGSGLNRLYNVLCLLWNIHSRAPLPRICSITNTNHWINYTNLSDAKYIVSWYHYPFIIVQRSNNLVGIILILLFLQMIWSKYPYTYCRHKHLC